MHLVLLQSVTLSTLFGSGVSMDRISFFKQEKIIPFLLNILENSNSIQKLWAKIMIKFHAVRYDFLKSHVLQGGPKIMEVGWIDRYGNMIQQQA